MSNNLNEFNTPSTDAEMEAQFRERNANLKSTLNNFVDSIDRAASKTQDMLSEDNSGKRIFDSGLTATNERFNTGSIGEKLSTGSTTLGSSTLNSSSGLGRTGFGSTTNRIGEHGINAADNFSGSVADRTLMNSIQSDINAMHSTDPEVFEDVATKMDETFAHNALI